ncbi:hypothetical protein CAPTEDRAFT_125658, partial [Capitella teleta]
MQLLVVCLSLLLSAQCQRLNETCPTPCRCQLTDDQGRSVNCAKGKLRSIPEGIPIDTQTLLLQGNAIRALHESLPPMTLLSELDLSNNRIASLGPLPLFENLTSLDRLDLQDNNIETLLRGVFHGLAALSQLLLSGNQIVAIDNHAFDGLSNLQTLSLSANKIASLRPECFANLTTLQVLSLSGNRLQRIGDLVFQPLRSLMNLSLSGNILSSIDSKAFSGLGKLRQLDLSSNAFSRVTSECLKVLPALDVLNLSDNPVKVLRKRSFESLDIVEIQLNHMGDLLFVDAAAFYDLPELKVLHLHDNPHLSFIDPDAFVSTTYLEAVYAQKCNLATLPFTMLTSLPRLKQVSFYDNPIQCDCTSQWMKESMISLLNATIGNHTAISFTKKDQLKCASPPEYRKMSLSKIPSTKITKSCTPTIVPMFDDIYQQEIGQTISYPCRAIGVPAPHIQWILPNGKVLNGSSNYSRLKLENGGTLTIEHLKPNDAGKYTCIASNPSGEQYDTATTVLRIHNKDI